VGRMNGLLAVSEGNGISISPSSWLSHNMCVGFHAAAGAAALGSSLRLFASIVGISVHGSVERDSLH